MSETHVPTSEAAGAGDPAQLGAGGGAGAGGASAGTGTAPAEAVRTGPPNRRGPKYAKVDAGMADFLSHYPVDVTGRMATLW